MALHVTWHACNMHKTINKVLIRVYMYAYRWGGVSICLLNVERFRTNTYMIYLVHTLFLTCIKHVMLLTWNMHVTCLLFAYYFCYMHCACYILLFWYAYNMHFAPTVTWLLSWHALHMSITFMLQAYLGQHACKC